MAVYSCSNCGERRDALAAAEKINWVFKGADCLAPEERLCLVALSDGGKDAVTV